jgi:hypothetical protein
METVEIPIVNKAITNVVLRPYHHNGQILLKRGRERNAIENVARGKTNWYCPPKEKNNGKNQNGVVDIEIKELNRCTN